MKKILALLLALVMLCSLAACGGDSNASGDNSGDNNSSDNANSDEIAVGDSEIEVFYYDFGDVYLSSVRSALDKLLGSKAHNNDAQNDQAKQTEQIQTAISKGAKLLVVNVVTTISDDAAQNIVNMAKDAGIPIIFFNRSVKQEIIQSYDKAAFVGTDYVQAGHMEGEMVGEYVLANYDAIDLNKDGKISYVLFKGEDGNAEAEARTQYGVEDADAILKDGGKPALEFYDSGNAKKYLVDPNGKWSATAAKEYMDTIFAQYSEANNNMVELVIANNDEMAIGAINSLQEKGYNKEGGTYIPVFGVDATPAAQQKINDGEMVGSIKQDAEGMAGAIKTIAANMVSGAEMFKDIDANNIENNWKVNIPYGVFKAE